MTLNSVMSAVARILPHTAQVANPRFLIPGAVATRVGIGLLRIEENMPLEHRKPDETRYQKWSSFLQRVWMEMVGVPAQIFSMLLLQDGLSHAVERSGFLKLPTTAQQMSANNRYLSALQPIERQAIDDAIKLIYQSPNGIVAKQIFNRSTVANYVPQVKEAVSKSLKLTAGTQLPQHLEHAVNAVLMPFHKRLWSSSASILVAGILFSAWFSGYVFQWLNDNPISKRFIPKMTAMMGVDPDAPRMATPGMRGSNRLVNEYADRQFRI